MALRARCYSCFRPEAHCLCDSIEQVEHRTEILILQHPRERAHAFNTVRIAARSLQNAEVVVGHVRQLALDETLAQRLRGFGLLYPSPGARDLAALPADERPAKLVVIDGTWHHARAMYKYVRALHGLPHYKLPAGEVSRFRIRMQPKSHCLSSLEAIRSALLCLEPDAPGLDGLLRPFERMQSQHLAAVDEPAPRHRRVKRKRKHVALPRALAEEFESLVVVYGELSPHANRGATRPLLTFAAERPSTGERLQHVIAEAAAPGGPWPFLRLSASEIARAAPLDEVRAAWKAFLRPGDTLAAWSPSTLQMVRQEIDAQAPALDLKSIYCNRFAGRGCLEDIVLAEGIVDADDLARRASESSRTEERLASAVAMARWLHGARRPAECLR